MSKCVKGIWVTGFRFEQNFFGYEQHNFVVNFMPGGGIFF